VMMHRWTLHHAYRPMVWQAPLSHIIGSNEVHVGCLTFCRDVCNAHQIHLAAAWMDQHSRCAWRGRCHALAAWTHSTDSVSRSLMQ
jgi:hypothetical protein